MRRVSGVAAEIDPTPAAFDHVTAPETPAPIEQAARGEMLGRREGQLERAVEADLVPPVELVQTAEPERSEQPSVAGGRQHGRCETLPQSRQRRGVEVVVVVVAGQ